MASQCMAYTCKGTTQTERGQAGTLGKHFKFIWECNCSSAKTSSIQYLTLRNDCCDFPKSCYMNTWYKVYFCYYRIVTIFPNVNNFCRLISKRNVTRYPNTVPTGVEKDSQRERYVVLIILRVCVWADVCTRMYVVWVCVGWKVSSYFCHMWPVNSPMSVYTCAPIGWPVEWRGLVLIFIPWPP